jgi:hypothetical protein
VTHETQLPGTWQTCPTPPSALHSSVLLTGLGPELAGKVAGMKLA